MWVLKLLRKERGGALHTERRVDVKEVLAINIIVGEMTEMHFIKGHLRWKMDHVVSREEREDDDAQQNGPAPLGDLGRLWLRKGLVEEKHVVETRGG